MNKKTCLTLGSYYLGDGPLINGEIIQKHLENWMAYFETRNYFVIALSKDPLKKNFKYKRKPIYIESFFNIFSRFITLFVKLKAEKLAYLTVLPIVILIKLFRIKFVLAVQPPISLILACRLGKIKIFDMLHGYGITTDHKVYGLANSEKNKNFLPHGYIALDAASEKVINSWAKLRDISVFSIENPQYKISKAEKKETFFNHYYTAQQKLYRSRLDNNEDDSLLTTRDSFQKKIILVTLQWGISRYEAKYPHSDGMLHPLIENVINHINTEFDGKFEFLIRPHPILWRSPDIIEKLLDKLSEIDVTIDSFGGIDHLLGKVDAHLTIFSSITRELALAGTKTMLFSSDDNLFNAERKFLAPELKYGMAMRVHKLDTSTIVSEILKMEKNTFHKQYHDEVKPNHNIEIIFNELDCEKI